MHIRYKQSCLIILRHISDRVINKHCKINEEKCDLQFPLIGKALAFPRRKVIARGRGEGRGGQAQGLCPFSAPAPPTPSSVLPSSPGPLPPASCAPGVESRCQEAGREYQSSHGQASPLWFEAQWDSGVAMREPRAERPTTGWARPPSLGPGLWAGLGTPAWPPPCSQPPALHSLLSLCHI